MDDNTDLLDLTDEENVRQLFFEAQKILDGFHERNVGAGLGLASILVVLSAIQEICEVESTDIHMLFIAMDAFRKKHRFNNPEKS